MAVNDATPPPALRDLLGSKGIAWVNSLASVLLTFQSLALPLAFYFKPAAVCLALVWLIYRATQVLYKPLDELATLLGFDIPHTPLVDLASIKADGAMIHWTLSEKQSRKSSLKYEIHLNGNLLDTMSIHESAVTITGLPPSTSHVIRVALVNSHEFGSKSDPIRFRTKSAESGDFFVVGSEHQDVDHDGTHERLPRTRPFRGLKDVRPARPTAAQMSREGSSGFGPRRTISGGRPSPVSLGLENKHDPPPDDNEPPEGAETVQQLTEKLDSIRRETDEAERQAREEEDDEVKQKDELIKERDELKAEAMDKEKASRNLKREVNTLERQNTAAQNERAKQERLLQQKKHERQRLKEDIIRWERQTTEIRLEVERTQQEKARHLEQIAKEKESIRIQLAEKTSSLRSLDDEVKDKTSEAKKIERSLRNSSPNGTEPEPSLVQQYQYDAEEERVWLAHRQSLVQQYQLAYNKVEAAKRFHGEQLRYLDSLRAERRRQEDAAHHASPPPTQERQPRRGDSQNKRQATSMHSTSDSPRPNSFPVSQGPFTSTVSGVSPGTFATAPFLNLQNGMTIVGPMDMSDEEIERFTGGALMSPGAGADLLPADLFSGDDNRNPFDQHVQPLPGLGSLPGLPGLAGSTPQHSSQEPTPAGPTSPGSINSRPPSAFASPKASTNNLHHIGSPENVIDSDRRSVRSNRSNRALSGGGASSRFSGMFGIKHRHRTAHADAGLPLSKANSMPKQDQGIFGLDSASRRRNSSISGAVFGGPFPPEEGVDASGEPPAAAKRAFGFFSRERNGGWPTSFTGFGRRPTSPRPGSTHSSELPRPSMDSSRWGVDTWTAADASGARSSPLSFGHLPQQQPRMFGSRHPSRRPSVQYGAASGPPADIIEDEDPDALDPAPEPHLAPIGTRPPSSSGKSTKDSGSAKLNPNAKDFKSFFSSMKLGGSGRDKSKDSTPPSVATTPQLGHAFDYHSSSTSGGGPIEDTPSPPHSRKSRDARSLTTTTTDQSSLAESSATGGRTSSEYLTRTPSHTTTDTPSSASAALFGTSASSNKESFMAKLTRKSSSGKFSLPAFRTQRGASGMTRGVDAAGSSSTIATSVAGMAPAGDEEDGAGWLSGSVGSLREGKGGEREREGKGGEREGKGSEREGNRASRTWSHVLKIGKGKKGETEMAGEDDGDNGEEATGGRGT